MYSARTLSAIFGLSGSFESTVICFSRTARLRPRLRVKDNSPFSPGCSTSGLTPATVHPQLVVGLPIFKAASPTFWKLNVPLTVSTWEVFPKLYTVCSNLIFGFPVAVLEGPGFGCSAPCPRLIPQNKARAMETTISLGFIGLDLKWDGVRNDSAPHL